MRSLKTYTNRTQIPKLRFLATEKIFPHTVVVNHVSSPDTTFPENSFPSQLKLLLIGCLFPTLSKLKCLTKVCRDFRLYGFLSSIQRAYVVYD